MLLEGGLRSRGFMEDRQQPCLLNGFYLDHRLSRAVAREQRSGLGGRKFVKYPPPSWDIALSLHSAFNSCIWVHINHHYLWLAGCCVWSYQERTVYLQDLAATVPRPLSSELRSFVRAETMAVNCDRFISKQRTLRSVSGERLDREWNINRQTAREAVLTGAIGNGEH